MVKWSENLKLYFGGFFSLSPCTVVEYKNNADTKYESLTHGNLTVVDLLLNNLQLLSFLLNFVRLAL